MSDRSAQEDTLRAAIDVLPETLLAYGNQDVYDDARRAVEAAILNAPTDDPRAIAQFGADALETLLEKRGLRESESARTFLAKIKHELGME